MKNITLFIKKKQIISEDIIYKNKNTEIKCIYAYNNKTNNYNYFSNYLAKINALKEQDQRIFNSISVLYHQRINNKINIRI